MPFNLALLWPLLLLSASKIFMTLAWYGHLRTKEAALPLVVVSWGIAFFEYCLAIPANRIGAEVYTLPQLGTRINPQNLQRNFK